mmetsp:Transcript_44373/g.140005  ORF Transcript_44373/g.140005 Transcript_44373/m.140005 type:complete len:83 (-) Transcript_44373:484-732(-)
MRTRRQDNVEVIPIHIEDEQIVQDQTPRNEGSDQEALNLKKKSLSFLLLSTKKIMGKSTIHHTTKTMTALIRAGPWENSPRK